NAPPGLVAGEPSVADSSRQRGRRRSPVLRSRAGRPLFESRLLPRSVTFRLPKSALRLRKSFESQTSEVDIPFSAAFSKPFTMFDRIAGILLHPTSLPGPFGIGDLGPNAARWID